MYKCVYIHKRNDTKEVFYVGEGSYKRPYSVRNRNKHWRNIVDKAGYEVVVLYTRLTKDEALDREQNLKELYGFENLCNLMPGRETGSGGHLKGVKRPEHGKKISKIQTGKTYTKEHRANIAKGKLGIEPWNKGKKLVNRKLKCS